MGLYKYLAAGRGEKVREVFIEGNTPGEALAKLRSRNLQPVKFCGESSIAAQSKFSLGKNKVNVYEFTRQLAPLLNSFIPLERALAIIAEGCEQEVQRNFVNSMRQGLHEGKKFSELIRSYGRIFPDYYANLIESGEETGCLPEVLNQLYKFMMESKSQKDFIVSSSIYPAVIILITILVVVLLFTVFIPKFEKIFLDMGREVPGAMNFLLNLSGFFAWAWWLVPLLAAAAVFALLKYYGRDEFKFKLHQLLIALPVAGRISVELEMCKYLRTLAIMLANQVEIIKTVRIAGKVIHNPVIAVDFKTIPDKLKSGQKLSGALFGNKFLPREMVPMLRVGEETGNVGEMLTKIADNLENETRLKIKRLLSLFEPAIIIVLAVVVLFVVVSIFVSMMEINSIS
ncbi:MAG: type II secretion system F family protein [Lentisphaeria bacterium]|nr:type II secretion system F family protein [Lentisphaeria bacterium]